MDPRLKESKTTQDDIPVLASTSTPHRLSTTDQLKISGWYDDKNNPDQRRWEELARFYIQRKSTIVDSFFFHISNLYNKILVSAPTTFILKALGFQAKQRWDLIIPNSYLGGIPSKEDIELILALAQPNQKVYVFAFVLPSESKRQATDKDWADHGVEFIRLPIADFTADVDPNTIATFIGFINDALNKGYLVYKHCKAGAARSAMIDTAYLAVYGFTCTTKPELNILPQDGPALRVRKAVTFLKMQRSQVNLHHEKLTEADWAELESKGTLRKELKAGKLLKAFQAVQIKMGLKKASDFKQDVPLDAESLSDYLDESLEEAIGDDHFRAPDNKEAPIEFPDDIFCSDKFKCDFTTQFKSFHRLQNFETVNKGTPHGTAISYLLQMIYFSSTQPPRNRHWFKHLIDCFFFLQSKGDKGASLSEMPQISKIHMREAFGAIGFLVTNSKMDDELYGLMNDLVAELQTYKNKYFPPETIHFKYIPEKQKAELRQKSPSEQYPRDVAVWKAYLFQQPNTHTHKGPLSDKRINTMKRIFLMLQHNNLQFKNDANGPYQSMDSVNSTLAPAQQMPLAALLSHGGRISIQLPPMSAEKARAFFYWLAGGVENISSEYSSSAAELEGCHIYRRLTSTHALEINNQDMVEKTADAKNYLEDWWDISDLGMNLGIKEIDHPGLENGSYGHLYINRKLPHGFMIGCESSTPDPDIESYYGSVHDRHATINTYSLTGGLKNSDEKFQQHPIHPYKTGGIKLVLTEADIDLLMQHQAAELTADQLSQPAGTLGCGYSPPSPTFTLPSSTTTTTTTTTITTTTTSVAPIKPPRPTNPPPTTSPIRFTNTLAPSSSVITTLTASPQADESKKDESTMTQKFSPFNT